MLDKRLYFRWIPNYLLGTQDSIYVNSNVMVCDFMGWNIFWRSISFNLLHYYDIFIPKYWDFQVNEEGKFNFTTEKEFYFVSKGPVISRNL